MRKDDIINLGKIPSEYKFRFKRTLQKMLINPKDIEEHTLIIEEIEKSMDLKNKIPEFNPSNWRFLIDKDYNFWAMSKEYVDKNFVDKNNRED